MNALDYNPRTTFMDSLVREMSLQQMYVNEYFLKHGLQANKIYFDEEAMRLVHQALLNEFLRTNNTHFITLAQYLEHKSHTRSFLAQIKPWKPHRGNEDSDVDRYKA
ncbi:hypothetical protein [Laceyella sacchari]|jgi:hypothetical protein|uniref:Uncharacterized protein n=1 Tax=Laceyella sacchari TaxID=37482 RepID=A0ABY5U3W8_LACSH|nr:hypothetical protein [Laceyella sacchari]TCW40697.1 hypothetical protein EDC32_101344 [Laceyella sacchari]UWE04334.1 hypothetical protein NYR52_04035 [Laceyella sacchari]